MQHLQSRRPKSPQGIAPNGFRICVSAGDDGLAATDRTPRSGVLCTAAFLAGSRAILERTVKIIVRPLGILERTARILAPEGGILGHVVRILEPAGEILEHTVQILVLPPGILERAVKILAPERGILEPMFKILERTFQILAPSERAISSALSTRYGYDIFRRAGLIG